MSLVHPTELDSEFLARIRAYKCGSTTFGMNIALLDNYRDSLRAIYMCGSGQNSLTPLGLRDQARCLLAIVHWSEADPSVRA